MAYLCPICQAPLTKNDRVWNCLNKHCFDIAKEGYINLMPVQFKHSKEPGDNQLMMQSRRLFLNSGYYQSLNQRIEQLIEQYLAKQAKTLLDLGCGEGYYTGYIATQLQAKREQFTVYGLDIAKNAIKSAAKRYHHVNFCVASSYRLPFATNSMDCVLRIYAPCDNSELQRVMTEQGILITVTPAPNHLRQLKALIYQQVKLHDDHCESISGFVLQQQQRLSYAMSLADGQAYHLLQMTPFAWRANDSVVNELKKSEMFECDADFYLNIYKKI